jgi:hypothetical protein
VVFWDDGAAYASRIGAPISGSRSIRAPSRRLVTCHWHHALRSGSGCTLDLWADDAPARRRLRGDDVFVRRALTPIRRSSAGSPAQRTRRRHLARRREVGARTPSTPAFPLGIVPYRGRVRRPIRRGAWGAGLTVLVAMANLIPQLDPADHAPPRARPDVRRVAHATTLRLPSGRSRRAGVPVERLGELVPPVRRPRSSDARSARSRRRWPRPISSPRSRR